MTPQRENSRRTAAAGTRRRRESGRIDGFRNSLLQWYGAHKRSLPWRRNPTPYRVWISEIMLQQTQVKSAIPYFDRFLKRFPDMESLGRASEEEILALWSGLGYYSRARNLHRTARRIVEFHNGIFPADYKTVISLPGIGRYTAGAICSIAFNQAHAVVDGNIRRVTARLTGIRSRIPERYFWDRMARWIPAGKASAFNQAMMELGATICLPSQPLCPQCPVQSFCLAKKKNLQNCIPLPGPRKTVEKIELVILILERKGKILLTRQENSFIPGEWGLPARIVPSNRSPDVTAETLNQKLMGGQISVGYFAGFRHSITNHRISVNIFTGKATGTADEMPASEGRMYWANDAQLDGKLTSSLFRKALRICRKRD